MTANLGTRGGGRGGQAGAGWGFEGWRSWDQGGGERRAWCGVGGGDDGRGWRWQPGWAGTAREGSVWFTWIGRSARPRPSGSIWSHMLHVRAHVGPSRHARCHAPLWFAVGSLVVPLLLYCSSTTSWWCELVGLVVRLRRHRKQPSPRWGPVSLGFGAVVNSPRHPPFVF